MRIGIPETTKGCIGCFSLIVASIAFAALVMIMLAGGFETLRWAWPIFVVIVIGWVMYFIGNRSG